MKRLYEKGSFDKRLYWVWAAMIQRCTNPANKGYKNYGGRGIKVCEAWKTFKNFANDVGPKRPGLTLDRIDNNGDYCPENVRWANRDVQASNRRYCIMIDDAGESITLKEYCRRHDLRYGAMVKRIRMRRWSMTDALSIPVGSGVWGVNRG